MKETKYRYRILALLFFATTINYLDRSVLGVLAPTLRDKVFGWSMEDYSYITIAFQLSYAMGLPWMGNLVDRWGARKGYALSIAIWSFFNLAHALVRPAFSLIGFTLVRFGLGLGESGNFPACAKAITEWFPPQQRAFATGVVNAGTNLGAILAPTLVPLVVSDDGERWPLAFLMSTALSLLWLLVWLRTYRRPEEDPRVNELELRKIQSGQPPEIPQKISWRAILPCRETWAFALMKTTDAVWWFYLFWGGIFLADQFKLSVSGLGLPLIIVFAAADVGSLFGGWLSGFLMSRGWSTNRARKLTLLLCVGAVFPQSFMTWTQQPELAMLLMALAAAGHQAWSVNIFTMVSDLFPKKAVASVIGFGGMVGSLATLVAFLTLGKILETGHGESYFFPFLIAGSIYPLTLLGAHLLTPKMTLVRLREE
ncbi:MAG: MFS transporter [Bdellovibrio sp.]|nr:MAG: MFS transporter [Bdellovibrio sp.]